MMKPRFLLSTVKLLAVGAIFYASYGFANWFTAQRTGVPEIIFAWEQHIPFWAWTIVPYWSLNVLYALAFFLCHNTAQQNRYIAQLLLAQAIAISCFLLFPLQFSWLKPATDGLSGSLFASLAAFDQPYNQAPSLHIILVLIVGRFYWHRLPQGWRGVWAAWFTLIALSVLSTWQHHFIDIPTGLLAGAIVLWALPWQGNQPAPSPLHGFSTAWVRTPQHKQWVGFYIGLAIVGMLLASLGGAWLWCLWVSVACLVVGVAYGRLGANALGKISHHRSLGAALLLFPHTLASYANIAFWLRQQPFSTPVTPRIHIGSIVAVKQFAAVLDVCAELPAYPHPLHYHALPMLDMVAPTPTQLNQAADALQQQLEQHDLPVLVCCALGYGRSAAVILTWWVRYGGANDLAHAVAQLQSARPQMVLPAATQHAILAALQQASHSSCHRPTS